MSGMEELRALAAQEEIEQVDEPKLEVVPEIENPELTPEPIEGETETVLVDELELELEGEPTPEPTKHTPEQALVYKLTKEKKKRQEAVSELDELKQTVAELKTQLSGNVQPQVAPAVTQPIAQPVVIPFPDLYDADINGNKTIYSQKVHEYMAAVNQQGQQATQQIKQDAAAVQKEQDQAGRLATRASKFIIDNKMNADKATDAIQAGTQALDDITGIHGAGLFMLDSVGDGSEKVAYYLSRNPKALTQVKALFDEDPKGFKAIAWLTKTAEKLKPKNQHISKAPAPDEPLQGDGSSADSVRLQSQYDKETDIAKLVKLKKQARLAGITLK